MRLQWNCRSRRCGGGRERGGAWKLATCRTQSPPPHTQCRVAEIAETPAEVAPAVVEEASGPAAEEALAEESAEMTMAEAPAEVAKQRAEETTAADTYSNELLSALPFIRPWERMKIIKEFGDREETQLSVAVMTPLIHLMMLSKKGEAVIALLPACFRGGDPHIVCADLEAFADTAFGDDPYNKRMVRSRRGGGVTASKLSRPAATDRLTTYFATHSR